jgi:hypothetical protein
MTAHDDKLRQVTKRLEPWFDAEIAALYEQPPSPFGTQRPRHWAQQHMPGPTVLLGCPIWGRSYIERFATYCLPTLGTPENLAALSARCRLVLYSPAAARPMLYRLTRWLRVAGIELQFREIPDDLLAEMAIPPDATPEQRTEQYDRQFCLIGCVQNLLTHMAGRDGMGFHMLMPDHVYAQGYFANMFRLATDHHAIAQAGLSVDLEAAKDALEMCRHESGALVIPDREMGDIAAAHLHPESLSLYMNHGSIPDRLPRGPRLIWQSQDALHVYSCFNNPAWLSPLLCADAPIAFTSTMDCLMPEFVADSFHVPTPADGMAFVEVSGPGKHIPGKWVDGSTYCDWVWNRLNFQRDYFPYFKRPMVLETSHNADMLTVDEVRRQFAQIMDLLEASRAAKLEAFTVRKFGSRFAREQHAEQGAS